MMALDHRRRTLERHGLDHVGVERSLSEKFRALHDFLGFKHVDERMADDSPLLLGVKHARQPRQKQFGRVGHLQIDSELARERILHPLALARARQSRIDEHAMQPRADRAMYQRGATEESTPPDSPIRTLSVGPTCLRISASLVSTKFAIVQSPRSPQIFSAKLRSTCVPHGVCTTSG